MTRTTVVLWIVLGSWTLVGADATAALLGTTPLVVGCGTVISVTAQNSGQTLTLDGSDPIFSTTCPADGITVVNKSGTAGLNQSFSIDCQTNQATPITGQTKVGILLKGVNLGVFNCFVHGFTTGIMAVGDGADIEDSQAEQATGNGFLVKARTRLTNPNLTGITFTGNRAFGNGGYGFLMTANEISGGAGSFFNNVASDNAKGGFFIKGDGNALSATEAYNNGGPGIVITSNSCCSGSSGQSFDTAIATFNVGPGIVYVAKNDGSNCVGGTGPTCAGGMFFPTGFDTTPGGISAFGNGDVCPAGALPYLQAQGVCPIVATGVCSQAALARCP